MADEAPKHGGGKAPAEVLRGEGLDTITREKHASYSTEMADELCERLATGMSLRKACEPDNMPLPRQVYRWLREKPEFKTAYEAALADRTEAMAEDLMDIADDGSNDYEEIELANGNTKTVVNTEAIQRSKLRVEARQWLMGKMKPRKYGPKIDMTTDGEKLPTPIYGGQSVKQD